MLGDFSPQSLWEVLKKSRRVAILVNNPENEEFFVFSRIFQDILVSLFWQIREVQCFSHAEQEKKGFLRGSFFKIDRYDTVFFLENTEDMGWFFDSHPSLFFHPERNLFHLWYTKPFEEYAKGHYVLDKSSLITGIFSFPLFWEDNFSLQKKKWAESFFSLALSWDISDSFFPFLEKIISFFPQKEWYIREIIFSTLFSQKKASFSHLFSEAKLHKEWVASLIFSPEKYSLFPSRDFLKKLILIFLADTKQVRYSTLFCKNLWSIEVQWFSFSPQEWLERGVVSLWWKQEWSFFSLEIPWELHQKKETTLLFLSEQKKWFAL